MNSIKNLQNLHTHTTYCDGVNTPEEMLEIAIKKGFSSLGFSGHSYMAYSPSYSMSMIGTDEYIRHINRLEKEYRDKIEIFCGIEFDMFSGIDLSGFDYILGAVHYLKIGDEMVGFDRSAKEVKTVIDTYFGGDGLSYARAYYETLSLLPEYCDADVVATTSYGVTLTAAVARDNVMGAQFHPEKSGEAGLRLLSAFAQM